MARGFHTRFADLPQDLAVFPLSGVILLPRVDLPLNIFEPRYIAMVDHALATSRLIGMIQPQADKSLMRTGTAGRITSIEETDDGRYLMNLRGVCRFDVDAEHPLMTGGFRHIRANWAPYADDMTEDRSSDLCRDKLVNVLKEYLSHKDMRCDEWDNIRTAGCERLVATLAMACPFSSTEKQALLTAKTLKERAEMLIGLLEMARNNDEGGGVCH